MNDDDAKNGSERPDKSIFADDWIDLAPTSDYSVALGYVVEPCESDNPVEIKLMGKPLYLEPKEKPMKPLHKLEPTLENLRAAAERYYDSETVAVVMPKDDQIVIGMEMQTDNVGFGIAIRLGGIRITMATLRDRRQERVEGASSAMDVLRRIDLILKEAGFTPPVATHEADWIPDVFCDCPDCTDTSETPTPGPCVECGGEVEIVQDHGSGGVDAKCQSCLEHYSTSSNKKNYDPKWWPWDEDGRLKTNTSETPTPGPCIECGNTVGVSKDGPIAVCDYCGARYCDYTCDQDDCNGWPWDENGLPEEYPEPGSCAECGEDLLGAVVASFRPTRWISSCPKGCGSHYWPPIDGYPTFEGARDDVEVSDKSEDDENMLQPLRFDNVETRIRARCPDCKEDREVEQGEEGIFGEIPTGYLEQELQRILRNVDGKKESVIDKGRDMGWGVSLHHFESGLRPSVEPATPSPLGWPYVADKKPDPDVMGHLERVFDVAPEPKRNASRQVAYYEVGLDVVTFQFSRREEKVWNWFVRVENKDESGYVDGWVDVAADEATGVFEDILEDLRDE